MGLDSSKLANSVPEWIKPELEKSRGAFTSHETFTYSQLKDDSSYRWNTPKNVTIQFVSRNRHYNTDSRFRIAIYSDIEITNQRFYIAYDDTTGHYIQDHHTYHILSKHDTLNAAQVSMSNLAKKHFQPILREIALKKSESIIDTPGQLCKTQIGFNNRCLPVRIGDHVIYDDKMYKGWIFVVEQ